MDLRPYQIQAKDAILAAWQSVSRTLLVLPTGTGKTIVFCALAKHLVAEGKRVLILAHRGELLDQAADKMMRSTGLGCAVEKAEDSAISSWYRITVGSVQTMMRQSRLESYRPDHYDAIIVDEAHHALSESYQRILAYFGQAKVLGVTATPDRGDMRNLGQYFDSLAFEYSLPRAIRDGYLAKIKALTIPLRLDMSKVSTRGGDYRAEDVGNALDPYLAGIAQEMKKHCANRKTVVFLPLIRTSQKMAELLASHGFRAAEVNGESKDRAQILADFDAGRYDVFCNSMLLTEGWDCPSVDCIVCLRPTKIRSLYCQIVGRGTRLHPGKDDLLLLDFLWHTEKHDLCRPAHLIAESAEVADKMTANMEEEAGAAVDLEEAEEKAESDCVQEREEALAKKLSEMKHRKQKLVDPLQFEMSIQAEDLASYQPAFGWEIGPATDKQRSALEKMGINPDEVENAGKAAKILDRLEMRRAEGLTTPKQIRFLERSGFSHVGTWQFDHARKLIDRIAANHWRVPHDINPTAYTPNK
jgi:superfamily II DNA or RNA helicase